MYFALTILIQRKWTQDEGMCRKQAEHWFSVTDTVGIEIESAFGHDRHKCKYPLHKIMSFECFKVSLYNGKYESSITSNLSPFYLYLFLMKVKYVYILFFVSSLISWYHLDKKYLKKESSMINWSIHVLACCSNSVKSRMFIGYEIQWCTETTV